MTPASARRPDRSATAEPVLELDPRDNALCESFVATLECKLLDRRRFHAEARMAVFPFIEGWYNPRPRHSAIYHPSTTKGASYPLAKVYNRPRNRGNRIQG